MKYETQGFDQYINIYDDKNKLVYYSVEVGYGKRKRALYDKSETRLCTIDFATNDFDDLMIGYPILKGAEKIGYFEESTNMSATRNVEFIHIVGPEWSFIENSERLTFREYTITDDEGAVVAKIKRPGTDFVCDISDSIDIPVCLTVISVEYWKYIATTHDF